MYHVTNALVDCPCSTSKFQLDPCTGAKNLGMHNMLSTHATAEQRSKDADRGAPDYNLMILLLQQIRLTKRLAHIAYLGQVFHVNRSDDVRSPSESLPYEGFMTTNQHHTLCMLKVCHTIIMIKIAVNILVRMI